jgi:hypothetical protein
VETSLAPHGCSRKVAEWILAHSTVVIAAKRAQQPFTHEWEPDFSEGEPDPRSLICGVCGREDDLWHIQIKKGN